MPAECPKCGVVMTRPPGRGWWTPHTVGGPQCRARAGALAAEARGLVLVDGEIAGRLACEGIPIAYLEVERGREELAAARGRRAVADEPAFKVRAPMTARGSHVPMWAAIIAKIAPPGEIGNGRLVRLALDRGRADPAFGDAVVLLYRLSEDDARGMTRVVAHLREELRNE